MQRVNISAVATLALSLLLACNPVSHETAQQLFERTVREYHLPCADATGAQREKLLTLAASGYETVLKLGRNDPHLCAAALRSLANVRVEQGRLDEAVRLYARVGLEYRACDWEVLQAWKSAADVLWDTGRQSEAAAYYGKIVQRFSMDPSPIIQTVATAARRRA